jgi:hypothetical protein
LQNKEVFFRTKESKMNKVFFSLVITFLLLPQSASSEVVEAGLFTQNSLRMCREPDSCRRRTLIEFVHDLELGETGMASTLLIDPLDITAQGASSLGFQGPGFTPAISSYASAGVQTLFTVGALAIQRYEFLSDGELNIEGALSYSQSGTTLPDAENPFANFENPMGAIEGGFLSFKMVDGVLETDNCNYFEGEIDRVNATGTMLWCILRNGEDAYFFSEGRFKPIEFLGLIPESVQSVLFDTGSDPETDALANAQLTVSGLQGDVFFVGAFITTSAHMGGLSDSRNTLLLEIDNPTLVTASFSQESFGKAVVPSIPALEELATNVEGVGPGKSLANKVAQAQSHFASFDIQATCGVLADFINQVTAQSGKKFISTELAGVLTNDSLGIIAAIGCE